MAYVALFGGTFDPIHLGHLAVAQGVLHQLGLDQILFLPNWAPPHKAGRRVTPAEDRAAMLQLAIAENPAFGYSDFELQRQGRSFTIDTIEQLLQLHPDWRIAFIVGMDSLLEIQSWRAYERLLTLVDLVVVNRPGYSTERRDQVLAQLGDGLTARIRLLEIPGVAISSTDLRRRAEQGYPLRYLVPDSVAAYIEAHGLYR